MGMKSDLKMPAPSQCFVHKPDEKRQLEHCIEKAMLDLLSKCMFGGIMITYNAPGFPLYYIDEQDAVSFELSKPEAHLIAAVEESHDQLPSARGPRKCKGRDRTGPSQLEITIQRHIECCAEAKAISG